MIKKQIDSFQKPYFKMSKIFKELYNVLISCLHTKCQDFNHYFNQQLSHKSPFLFSSSLPDLDLKGFKAKYSVGNSWIHGNESALKAFSN